MQEQFDWPGVTPVIAEYEDSPATCREYDERAPQVAALLAQTIERHLPDVIVEHIGSTSVPGCAGKGIIDLMVLHRAGELERTKSLLDALGFQRQRGRDPFPESRPMRKGAIEFEGTTFRIHAHVIAIDSPEAEELRGFRDRLRREPALLAAYVERKREILAAGVNDSLDYSIVKGEFIQRELEKFGVRRA